MQGVALLCCLALSDCYLTEKSQRRPSQITVRPFHIHSKAWSPECTRRSLSLRVHKVSDPSPNVVFLDPASKCHVTILGCFHGAESSSQDVVRLLSSKTDIVVLELCPARFADLLRDSFVTEHGETSRLTQKPWLLAYWEMISKTTAQRGLPTGLAAGILGGFSGVLTTLSGFTPGLEFRTAMKLAQKFGCDVILADQDVDETLRKVGNIPRIAVDTLTSRDRIDKWRRHHHTLFRAVFGQKDWAYCHIVPLPQVNLPLVLVRNFAAIQDFLRLTVPPWLLFWVVLSNSSLAVLPGVDLSTTITCTPHDTATLSESIFHWVACGAILSLGYLGLALPAVSVILTERDEILTIGIQTACRRAGEGGHVVAILGLLHVNGVAKRMLCFPSTEHPEMEIEEDVSSFPADVCYTNLCHNQKS